MKKFFAIFVAMLLICSMTCAFAFNWSDATVLECEEYLVSAVKYAKIDSDFGTAFEKAPGATAKVGDIVYFDISATDAKGNAIEADIKYHHLGNIEAVGKLYSAKVVGNEPWVKVSVIEKTSIEELKYDGKPIIINDNSITIGDLVFTRNGDGVVTGVDSSMNIPEMLAELAKLGIDIQTLYDGKIHMSDDILISNFGRVCETSATAAWYVQAEEPSLGIPKTGSMPVLPAAVCLAVIALAIPCRKR